MPSGVKFDTNPYNYFNETPPKQKPATPPHATGAKGYDWKWNIEYSLDRYEDHPSYHLDALINEFNWIPEGEKGLVFHRWWEDTYPEVYRFVKWKATKNAVTPYGRMVNTFFRKPPRWEGSK